MSNVPSPPDTDRFLHDLHELRRIGAFKTGVHRPTYSQEDMQSRRWLMERMREVGVLYDRDDDGEFLQLYTRTVGGVFLEVVERRGGYDGYGAPNAGVRLAAQDSDR